MNSAKSLIFDIFFPFGNFLETVEERKNITAVLDLVFHVVPLTFFIYWLLSFIPYGSLVYITIFTLIASERYIQNKKIISLKERLNTRLWYLVVLICGFGAFRNFLGHFFLADSVAQSIGWLTGSQFQTELAFYHLGVGISGFAAIWLKKNLIIGLAIINTIFGLGAAYVHLKDIVTAKNFSAGNTGSILLGDIIIPLIFIILLFSLSKYKDKSSSD